MSSVTRLRDVLAYQAQAAGDRSFLQFCEFDGAVQAFTYAHFHDRVRRLATGLRELGLRPQDRCLLALPNSVAFMLAFWAAQEVGAVAVPTVAGAASDELAYLVGHCEPWGVVTDVDGLAAVSDALEGSARPVVVAGGEGAGGPDLDALIGAHEPSARGQDASETAMLLYTSGTTARPKGVLLSHAACLFAAESNAQHLRLQPADRTLTCLPLFHVNGALLQMLPVALTGAALVLTPRFSVSRYWGWVARFDISMAHLVAGPVRLLLSDAAPAPDDHTVRAMTFGLPLTDAEIERFERRFGIPLIMAWGLTESCAGGTLMPMYSGRRPGHQAIGVPLHGWDLRVFDDDDRELLAGEVGELVIRSPGIMSGYYRDPDATAEALRNGWLHTGDLGYAEPDGHLRFHGRKKDMIKPSGENVAASEVERVLADHPAVQECAVIGVPDPVRSEAVKAYVVCRPGETAGEDELIVFCAERLSAFKVPTKWELVSELPKTSIGKVNKGLLRSEAARAT